MEGQKFHLVVIQDGIATEAISKICCPNSAVRKMFASSDVFENVTNLLYDQHFIRFFDPICELINLCQSRVTSCAEAD